MKYIRYVGRLAGYNGPLYGEIIHTYRGRLGQATYHKIKFRETFQVNTDPTHFLEIFDVEVEHISENEYLAGVILDE